jgi:2,3-bisphosphoglycerate-independent phosphoglycerate mutase
MKGIIMIMDGMGDRPLKELGGKTPLEAANTPNMDKMAKEGITGIMDSIKPGIMPGSDTAHLSILGYNPYEVYTGRGPFEAAGVGVDVLPGDIAFRCNFSSANDEGIVTDRRAGRIKEGTNQLAEKINGMKIDGFEDVEVIFKESTGHRAVLVLRGEGLSGKVSDADPKVEGKPPKEVKALDDTIEAQKTADVLNKLVKETYNILKDHPVNLEREANGEAPANIIIPRGAGEVPYVESLNEKYNVKSACIAETGLILGIGRLAGMDVIEPDNVTGGVDTDLDSITNTILENLKKDYNFFLINIDGADEAGHDGNAQEKLEFIEKADAVIGEIMKVPDLYYILTADHSTPISVMNHSGDPVPIVIRGPEVKVDDVNEFNERSTAKGGLCRIRGSDLMNILMDLMNNSEKFGA